MKLQRDELPLHFEGFQLRRRLVVAGWPLAVAVAGLGVTLAGTARDPLVSATGLVLGVLGAMLIAGLVRCRRCEIVVGHRTVTTTVGPLRRRVPVGLTEDRSLRSATSWRRLYADRELVLELPDRGEAVVLPTAEPEALRAALLEARTTSRARSSD